MGGRDEGKGEISTLPQKYHLNEVAVALNMKDSDRSLLGANRAGISISSPEVFEGVAVTTFLGAPKV